MQRLRSTGAAAALLPFLIILFACGAPPVDSSATRPGSNARQERLQTIVDQLAGDTGIPGISVAILEGSDAPIAATAGVENRETGAPVGPDTMFFIGSISKNLFATIALRLVDRNELSLDDPLSKFVEWPRGDEITVKMLMRHTSGIPEYLTSDRYTPPEDGGFPLFFQTPRTPAEIFETLPDRAPAFDPGTRQDYSNTNGLLVGEVLRTIQGEPLHEVLEDEIVRPLGLDHMYLFGAATKERARARGYCAGERWGAPEGGMVDCSAADEALPDSADGSVVASALDLLHYHRALREGRLLSEASWSAMRTSEPGTHNGLGYLMGQGPFGRYEGNVGRAMGHVAASVYYVDHETYVVLMTNLGDAPLPLRPFLEEWFGPESSAKPPATE